MYQIDLKKIRFENNLSQEKLGNILGYTKQHIGRIEKGVARLSEEKIDILKEKFNIELQSNIEEKQNKVVNIPYWAGIPEHLRDKDFDNVPIPQKVIVNKWKLDPEKLFIVPVVDDGMSKYWYKILKEDVLIIDTSENYVNSFGVYFATSKNNTRFWVREVDILANEIIEFHRYAEEKIIKTYTRAELEAADFKIIGKVIKNISLRL